MSETAEIGGFSFTGAALWYAEQGLPVFPVAKKTKRPYKNSHGYKDATTDEETICSWGERYPNANVAISCGDAHWLVLDTDPRHGGDESLERFIERHGDLPQTVHATTGGGGSHHVFRNPGGVRGGQLPGYPGLEVKAVGGYIVVAPSIHASGRPYEWVTSPDAAEPADPPRSLLALLNGAGTEPRDHPRSALGELLTSPPSEGERNEWLTRVAGHYARIFRSYGDYELHVLEAARTTSPPMDNDEARTVAKSIWSREERKYEHDVEEELGRLRIREEARRRLRVEHEAGGNLALYGSEDAEREAASEIDWVIPDLVAAGDKTVIAGPPKSLKTWFALHLVRCIALAGSVLDEAAWQVPQSQPVLFLQEEGTHQRWARRLQAAVFDEDPMAPVSYTHRAGFSLHNESHVAWLIEQAQGLGARAIFLDPLQRITPGVNENDATEVGPAWDAINRVAIETGAAVTVLHHARKGNGQPSMDSIRGSSRVAGEVDLILVLRRVERGTLELYLDGRDLAPRADVEQGNLEIRYDGDAPHQMRIGGVRVNVKGPINSTRPAVEQVLREAGGPMTAAEINDSLGQRLGRQRNPSTVNRTLNEMAEDGLVRKDGPLKGKANSWTWIGG